MNKKTGDYKSDWHHRKAYIRVYEYFNRLIEIDEEPVTEWEEKIERYKELIK